MRTQPHYFRLGWIVPQPLSSTAGKRAWLVRSTDT